MTNLSTSMVTPLETSAEPHAKRRKLKELAQEIQSLSDSNTIKEEMERY